jgi:hypothetical protein
MFIQYSSRRMRALIGRFLAHAARAIARRNEWDHLSTGEISSIAQELHMTPATLIDLAQESPESILLLDRRLEHAGLRTDELSAAHGDVLRDLQRVCSFCPVKARCASDLDRERRASPSKYCPNEQTLQSLARGRNEKPTARIIPIGVSRN